MAYCDFPHSQRYAIMIDGAWGSGKTFLWAKIKDHILQRGLNDGKNKPLYISLYGVKDSDEVSDLLFQQMHPVLGSKSARLAGALLKGALKTAIKIDFDDVYLKDTTLNLQGPDIRASDLTGEAQERVIVFDDFERARMSPIEVLGYINPLVEHDGCKVIILANEAEIKDDIDEYKIKKEKTIGQTLRVTADAEFGVFRLFARDRRPWSKRFLQTTRGCFEGRLQGVLDMKTYEF